MSTSIKQDFRLPVAELTIRQTLGSANASPFIAHVELEDRVGADLSQAARQFVDGRAERIARLLTLHPAATLWLLVYPIAVHYGEDDDFAIYRRIARSFGIIGDDIPSAFRGELNAAFRKACQRLGLNVAGFRPIGFVDDYVFQAGVPRCHLPSLVDAFLQAEMVMGPPTDDDTQALNAWQDDAAEFAPWALTRLRNILRQDETAYYAACFARVRRGEGADYGVESAMAEEIRRAEQSSSASRAPWIAAPSLSFIDEALSVTAPPTSSIAATVGNRERIIPAGGQLILPSPWPTAITWRFNNAEQRSSLQQLPIFGSERRILAFDPDNGRLIRVIGPTVSKGTVSIDAREVVLIAPAPFRVADEESVPLGRGAYALFVSLRENVRIKIDGIELSIAPPSRPLIEPNLLRIGRSQRGPLCGMPQSVRLRFPGGRPDAKLELHIQHPSLVNPRKIPVPDGPDVEISTAGLLPESGPAGPLRLSVTLADKQRALVRASSWVWPGLASFANNTQFKASQIPPNFCPSHSRHIVQSDGQLALALDESYRTAEIAFLAADKRIVQFEFVRPGLTIALVSDDGTERFVPEGATLTARADSTDSLVIRSSEVGSGLDVLGQHENLAFGKRGVRRIAMAALASGGLHDEIRFLPANRPESARTLVKVAPATQPKSFVIERDRRTGDQVVRLALRQEIDAVKLIATNVATGDVTEAAVALGRWPVDISSFGLLDGNSLDGSGQTCEVRIHAPSLPPGIWIGELVVRRMNHNHWMPLKNARGDRYIVGIKDDNGCQEYRNDAPLFIRLTDALLGCVAEECWPSYSDIIKSRWQALGGMLATSAGGRRVLLAAAARPISIDASPTWVPLLHPVELAPDLFSATAAAFAVFDNDELDGGAELASIARTASLSSVGDGLHSIPLSLSFYQGFANFSQAARDERIKLRDFSFDRYRAALRFAPVQQGVLWRPKDGRLSAAHHAWCLTEFADRVQRTVPDGAPNNGNRIPRAAQLASQAMPLARHLCLTAPEPLVERLSLAESIAALFSYTAQAWRSQKAEKVWAMLAQRTGRSEPEILSDFGFLARLAPELLGFYLLLWELVQQSEIK